MRTLRLRGVTALELMVVLAVVAVLAALAAPAWQDFMARQRRDALAGQLTAHLALARNAALSRGRPVALSTQGNGWHSGWRVHMDLQRNGRWDEGETVLAEHPGDAQAHMVGNGVMTRYVLFDADGRPRQANGGLLAGSLLICMPSRPGTVALVMSAVGRIRQETRKNHCIR